MSGLLRKSTGIFKARLHIGYLAFPYAILGFFIHFALYSFDLDIIFNIDEGSFLRLMLAIAISFIYMPYVFIINDFFDAPFDKLDSKKKDRNPFCDDEFRNKPIVWLLITVPAFVTLIFGFYISQEAGIMTLLALFFGTFYSAPPLRFKERAIADFLVHGFCLGLYFFSLGFFSIYLTANPFGLPIFWLTMTLAFVDGAWIHLDSAFVDFNVDKMGDQKTSVVFLGPDKAKYFLIVMLLVILCLPTLFFTFVSKLNFEINALFSLLFLMLPISYIVFLMINNDHFEKIREISSRYRVYTVYIYTIMSVLLSNVSITL